MRWGESWGKLWGLIEELKRKIVEVRLIQGRMYPCKTCRWYSVCIVPKKKNYLRHYKSSPIQVIYQCEDYTSKDDH